MARHDNPLEYAASGEPYLGSKIRELRQQKGWRLEEMARRISYHPGSLSKVENNDSRPSDRMLQRIAEVLEVPLADLRGASLHPRVLEQRSPMLTSSPVAYSRRLREESPDAMVVEDAEAPSLAENAQFGLLQMQEVYGPPPPAPRAPSARFADLSREDPFDRHPGPLFRLGVSPFAARLRAAGPELDLVMARVEKAGRRLAEAGEELGHLRGMISELADREAGAERNLRQAAEDLREARAMLADLSEQVEDLPGT